MAHDIFYYLHNVIEDMCTLYDKGYLGPYGPKTRYWANRIIYLYENGDYPSDQDATLYLYASNYLAQKITDDTFFTYLKSLKGELTHEENA